MSDLIPWDRNPRQIGEVEGERLSQSLDEFGQIQTIAIGPDGSIYDGHQRQLVWSALDRYGPDHEVDVRMSSRLLTEKEREKLVVYLHQGTVGEWNWDLLDKFDLGNLGEWGFKPYELGLADNGIDHDELWQGMPEFEQDDSNALKTIKVHFAVQIDIEDFSALVKQNITDKTKSIWFPEREHANLKELSYKGES